MDNKKNMGEELFKLLPQIYHKEDAGRTHLERFMKVNGVGLNFLKGKASGYSQMFDLDNSPPEFLPHIAKMMGFEYPYDMTVKEQRSMLKVLPVLYGMKGTKLTFDYLARTIFSVDARANSEWVSRGGLNGENLIIIKIEVDESIEQLQTRIDRYYKYSEMFRPTNQRLNWHINIYYTELYNRLRLDADYQIDKIFMDDDYDPNISPVLNKGLILGDKGIDLPRLMGEFYDFRNIAKVEYLTEHLKTLEEMVYNIKDRETPFFDKVNSNYLDKYDVLNLKADYQIERIFLDDDFDPNLEPRLNKGLILGDKGIDLPLLKGEFYDLRSIAKSESFLSKMTSFEGLDLFTREIKAENTDVTKTKDDDIYNEEKELFKEEETVTRIKYDDNRVIGKDTYFNKWLLNSNTRFPSSPDEAYTKEKFDEVPIETLLETRQEVYNKESVKDESKLSLIRSSYSDVYTCNASYEVADKTIALDNSLFTGKLNSTMLLSKNPKVVYI